jgi:hypothetical protein
MFASAGSLIRSVFKTSAASMNFAARNQGFENLRQRRAGTVVLRETRVREETWSQLKDRGALTDAKKYKNAEDAASVLLASGGPVHVVNEKLEIF